MTKQYVDVPSPILGKQLQQHLYESLELNAVRTGVHKAKRPIYAFKKATDRSGSGTRIINLIIPKGALVVSGIDTTSINSTDVRSRMSRKIRTDRVIVDSIYRFNNGPGEDGTYRGLCSQVTTGHLSKSCFTEVSLAHSIYRRSFVYRRNTVVTEGKFAINCWGCEEGIHAFLNLQDALLYNT